SSADRCILAGIGPAGQRCTPGRGSPGAGRLFPSGTGEEREHVSEPPHPPQRPRPPPPPPRPPPPAPPRQYVRKVSGVARPTPATEAAFEQAVATVARATAELLKELPPRRQPPKADPP